MKELHTGYVSLKELSEWFGLKPETLSKSRTETKQKKMEILKEFADYHMEGKKIIVDEVKIPVYSKAYGIIEEKFPKIWGKYNNVNIDPKAKQYLEQTRIDTCTRVGDILWGQTPEINSQIGLETAKNYTNKAKRKQYGRNYIDEYGTRGYSKSVWMNEDGTRPLNEEEMKIFRECAKEAFAAKKVTEQLADIEDEYKKGYLTKREYEEAKLGVDTTGAFDYFVILLTEKLGYYPPKKTQLIDTLNFEEKSQE